jgi:hypothetical protein
VVVSKQKLNHFLKTNFMAQIGRGILGPTSGSVGTVTAAKWKGIQYLRIKQGKRTGKLTEAQLAHLAKFAFVGRFIKSMSSLLPKTFKSFAVKKTQQNYAFSYVMNNAVTGNYPDFAIDYPKVLIAEGTLLNADGPSAFSAGSGKVGFKWTDNTDLSNAKANDRAILVIYCEELNQCIYKAPAATRQAGEDQILCSLFKGKPVQTWVSFQNASGDVATSYFTGVVNVEQ